MDKAEDGNHDVEAIYGSDHHKVVPICVATWIVNETLMSYDKSFNIPAETNISIISP